MNNVIRTLMLCVALLASMHTSSAASSGPAPSQEWSLGDKVKIGGAGLAVSAASIVTTYLIMRALHKWKMKQEQARMRAAYQVSQVETEHERDMLREKNRKLEETILHLSNVVSRSGKGEHLANRIVRAASKNPVPVPLTSSDSDGVGILADSELENLKR